MPHAAKDDSHHHFAFDPQALHMQMMRNSPRKLAFRGDASDAWSSAIRTKLVELLRMPTHPGTKPVVTFVGETIEKDGYIQRDRVIQTEPGCDVPCTLVTPKNATGPLPVMLCAQGHTSGMHVSLGEAQYDGDAEAIEGDRDFAVQAVRRGFAAISVELRAFGLCSDHRPERDRLTSSYLDQTDDNRTCKHQAMTALLLGRTIFGERIFDLTRICDAIPDIAGLDGERIYMMGQSGGGSIGWYALAIEPRLKGAMLGSSFGTISGTIGTVDHCTDNYLPDMLTWMDFPDVAGAIDTAKVVVVMGKDDPVFPRASVVEAGDAARAIFAARGRGDNFDLILADGGHRFYADLAWGRFLEMI